MNVPGKLIVFEGIDGCGKTTQARRLHEHLKSHSILNALFREPGGTPLGEAARKILLARDDFPGGIGEMAEYLLFAAARSELARLILTPLREQGITVLLDRFGLSSVAYQGYGRGLEVGFIKEVNERAASSVQPDLILLFDLDVETAFSRVQRGFDRIEQYGRDFFERVRQGYLTEAETNPALIRIIDATRTEEEVFVEVCAAVEGILFP